MESSQVGGMVSGAASGALAGSATGNPFVVAGGAVVGGVLGAFGSGGEDANAQAAQNAADSNAVATENAANYNAYMTLMAGQMNADMAIMAGQLQIEMAQEITQYNMENLLLAGTYQVDSLLDDIPGIWDAAELDIRQRTDELAALQGATRAVQAASGTVLDEGSNEQVLVSQAAAAYMDTAIIEKNADEAARNITNAAAESWWHTEMAVEQAKFDGAMTALNAYQQSSMAALNSLTSAGMQAQSELFNAGNQASAIRYGGDVSAWQYEQAGNQAMWSGIMDAASTTAQVFGKTSSPEVPQSETALKVESVSPWKPPAYTANWSNGYTTELNLLE